MSDAPQEVRNFAAEQINKRRSLLIEALIAERHQDRWNAAEELGTAWSSDPALVPDLIAFAQKHNQNKLAIYNVTTVLADLHLEAFLGHRQSATGYLYKAERNGPKTAALVKSIRKKLENLPDDSKT